MNNSNSLEKRYSFNIAQGGHVAESTHLDESSFSWGSTSPKLRSYSNLNNSTTSCDLIANSNVHVTKVDARVAADVQSKGLASRIVKYHDSGTRLSRSMSAHNLFSKPGQFPVVTLKKTNLPYRAAKKEISMIRISPPDKSVFYGNTVSGLMRSSSVIGLQSKQNDVLSTENSPIIHPPPTENDMAPTRSVLDVLKEISRKRINSDELESEEITKKYCSRASNDFVDTIDNKSLANQQDCSASPSFLPCQRYKRQRDCMTPQHGNHLVETKTSPEQAKKRVCNYNNDITSSLSSSIKSKKISTPRNMDKTLGINFPAYETQKLKEQHNFDHQKTNSIIDIRLKNIENSSYISETSICNEQIKSTVTPEKPASKAFSDLDEKDGNDSTSIELNHKPRLTLFNKKYDNNESQQAKETCEREERDLDNYTEEDCTGIAFVKPKKIASKSGLRNPVIERTQKSKLALMLSGLRGELYQNHDLDEIDCSSKEKELQSSDFNNTKLPTLSDISTTTITTLTTNTSTTTVTISNVEKITDVKSSLSPSSPLAANTNSSPLVGLKLKPTTENMLSFVSDDIIKNTNLQSKSNLPVLGGFFCASSSSSTSAIQTCINLKSDSKITNAQIASTPITTSMETIKPISASMENGKINEISVNVSLSTNNNLVQFPGSCKASDIPTNNANTVITSSSLTIGNTVSKCLIPKSNTSLAFSSQPVSTTAKTNNTPVSSSSATTASIVFGTPPTVSIAKPINSFNFTVPSTSAPTPVVSSAPLLFSSTTNSTTLTKTTVLPEISSPSSSFLLNSNTKPSSEGISSFSFSIDGNKSANSTNVFGTVVNSTTKALSAGPVFTFNSDAKSQNIGDQNNLKTENKVFDSSTLSSSNSQCFNTKATESLISVANNGTKSSENKFFNPSGTTSIFGSSTVKAGTEIFGVNSNDKSASSVTTSIFGSDKAEKSIPFNFSSGTATVAAKSSSNVNTSAGGFSFNSAVCNSEASEETKSTSNNTLSGASVPVSQNNFMFGLSSNKLNASSKFVTSTQSEILPQGGFSFGSTTPLKSSTFSFGTGAGKPSANDVTSSNNLSANFTFGAPSNSKQNVLSNKPFSFGSSQPIQQKQSDSTNIGSSSNIFDLSSASKATQPPVFNFSSSSQPNSPPPTNIFTQPTSNVTTGPGDRRIRRGTRRLQK